MPFSIARLGSLLKRGRDKLLPSGAAISEIAVIDMLAHNWHLGLTAFGGPTVHFQIFRRLFVEKYQWIDEPTYQEMFALCQALSGPASTKMIYGINILRYGFWVGLVSFLVWSLPMAIAVGGLAYGVAGIGNELPGPVYALLSGLNSATVGIIALAGVQLSQKAITDKLTRVLVFLGGAAGMLYNALWYFPVLMAGGGFVTVVWDLRLLQRGWRSFRLRKRREEASAVEEDGPSPETVPAQSGSTAVENNPSVHQPTEVPQFQPTARRRSKISSWKFGLSIIVAFFCSFTIVMVCRGIFGGESLVFDLFANLYLAGTIIFGGGPVVVPLLREYIVNPGWVSARDFLLGLAITQAFPGPNFNFAVYLGVLALQKSTLPPILGGFVAYMGIYMPGLWLYVGFMGLWSTVRRMRVVRSCLRGMHASAVGLVFTAVYRLFKIGYLDKTAQNGASLDVDPWWVVIVATSFVGGMHFHLPPAMAIALGGVLGLVWYGAVGPSTAMEIDRRSVPACLLLQDSGPYRYNIGR